MSYRAIALDVLPEIQSLAEKVLSAEKLKEVDLVAQKLLKNKEDRKWAIAKATLEVGLRPSRPLMYWSTEMRGLPRNTRNCIRYLGDYMDLLVKEMTYELLGGNARCRSLGSNARLLVKNVPKVRELADKITGYADFIYTPGKHDFSLPPGRKHSFSAKEVVLTAYITAKLAGSILSISKYAQYAVEKDNLYSIGGRWGNANRVKFKGEWDKRKNHTLITKGNAANTLLKNNFKQDPKDDYFFYNDISSTNDCNQNQIVADELYDRLNSKHFKGNLPKYKIIFKKLPNPRMRGYTCPDRNQIWMLKEYDSIDLSDPYKSQDFEDTLLHEMVHVACKEAGYQGWGDHYSKEFKELAIAVGARLGHP